MKDGWKIFFGFIGIWIKIKDIMLKEIIIKIWLLGLVNYIISDLKIIVFGL